MRLLPIVLLSAPLLLSACGQSGDSAQGGGEAERSAALIAELPAPYNTGDPVKGKAVFTACSACHTLPEGGANMVGPNLHGMFGAAAAAKADYAYSDALKSTGWTWDAERLDQWFADPKAMLPETKMVFVGVKDPQQRANLIAFLKVATSS
jgi:cytochrome c